MTCYSSFHSINVPSEWEQKTTTTGVIMVKSFHSINVPSEWELPSSNRGCPPGNLVVSIQLMSPASGNFPWGWDCKRSFHYPKVSIQLMSPASGNNQVEAACGSSLTAVSIQLMSPASGNLLQGGGKVPLPVPGFHSINVPSEWEPPAR